ncbi:serine hydrolase domain-containing protein [Micromonospora lupini]|uniref:serine hydrolase domain-containing protein n=1 Tax=Micromonospora lupini TaxID=285679 RepID=UPI0034076C5D
MQVAAYLDGEPILEVHYDLRIAEVWPEFARHGKDTVTLRHALTHTAGVPALPADVTPEDFTDWDRMYAIVADAEPIAPPGELKAYHAWTFGWLVGEVVRRATGRRAVLRPGRPARRPAGRPGRQPGGCSRRRGAGHRHHDRPRGGADARRADRRGGRRPADLADPAAHRHDARRRGSGVGIRAGESATGSGGLPGADRR